jgi:hypothetical protein
MHIPVIHELPLQSLRGRERWCAWLAATIWRSASPRSNASPALGRE